MLTLTHTIIIVFVLVVVFVSLWWSQPIDVSDRIDALDHKVSEQIGQQEEFMRKYQTAMLAAIASTVVVAAAQAECVDVGVGADGRTVYKCAPPPKPVVEPIKICETVNGVLFCNFKPDITPLTKPAPRVPSNCHWNKKGVFVCQ